MPSPAAGRSGGLVIDNRERIARVGLQAASEGAKVLVIHNTVRAAVALRQALEAYAPNPIWLFQNDQSS